MTKFYLIDLDYDVIEDNLYIILFGRTESGQRMVILDPSYEPYFYVLPGNIEKARKEISEILKKEGVEIRGMEVEKKNLFGEDKEFLKIRCFLPPDPQKIRDLIKGLEKKRGGSGSVIDEFEYQTGFYRTYLVDNSLSCLDWLSVEGEPRELPFKADLILKAKKISKSEGKPFPLKVLAFDTEVIEEKRGERQLIMLSVYGDKLQKVLTYKKGKFPDFVEIVKDEKALIERFVEIVREYDPDVISGYNSDLFDFVVLRERAAKLKARLDDLSVDRSGVTLSKRARVSTARLKGIVHIDIFNFVNNLLAPMLQTEVLSLDAVSSEILGDEKIEMEYSDILEAWKEERNLETLAHYSLKDSELTYRLSLVLLPQICELTRIVGQSLFDVSRMMYSQLVEWYYTRRAKEMGKIIPNQPKFEEIQSRQKETYIGGFVREPEAGLHENIAVIDFASLYPSISATYNISLETLNCPCCPRDGHKVPDLPHWFCKKKPGFESTVIMDLLSERQKVKKEMKKYEPGSLEFNLLNNRQLALKTIANASYGYYAFPASKWYSKECAESITSFGRYWIKKIMDEAESAGFKPIYGDTDSAFLSLDGKSKKALLNFLEEVNEKLPGIMHMELENFYQRGIFIPREVGGGVAKKRYALIDENGILKIRGLEKVRRDWSNLSKRTQEGILKLILEKKDVRGAIALVKESIKKLKERKVELKDLVVYEQLSKPLSEYKQISPHIGAAKKLVAQGIPVSEGSVIGFVIEKGKGSISERAQPIELANLENVDTEYYINNQIIPASLRILKVLGVKEEEIS